MELGISIGKVGESLINYLCCGLSILWSSSSYIFIALMISFWFSSSFLNFLLRFGDPKEVLGKRTSIGSTLECYKNQLSGYALIDVFLLGELTLDRPSKEPNNNFSRSALLPAFHKGRLAIFWCLLFTKLLLGLYSLLKNLFAVFDIFNFYELLISGSIASFLGVCGMNLFVTAVARLFIIGSLTCLILFCNP